MGNQTLLDLAKTGNYDTLESEWMEALEADAVDVAALGEVLEMVARAKETARAEVLAWAALSSLQARLAPAEALAAGRELILHAPGSEDLRTELVALYRKAYADHPQLERALDLSGLGSGQRVRKALKTLDACLHLEIGAYILHRFDEQVAEILELDQATFQVVLRTSRGRERLGPDQLAANYDFIDANDFRALRQLYPERITELVENDPVALVIGMLRGHGNRMDADSLRHILCPAFLPDDRWSKWWSKARNRIKKSPHILIEGRNPPLLTYDSVGQTLEQETWPAMEKTFAAVDFLEQLEAYLREAKSRKQSPSAEMLGKLAALLGDRIAQQLSHSPAEAFANALVYQRLQKVADVPDGPNGPGEILAEADDPVALVAELSVTALWTPALAFLEQTHPENWVELFGRLLAVAPAGMLDELVERLDRTDHLEDVIDLIGRVLDDAANHVDALTWLWRGPKLADKLPMPTHFDLLIKSLNVLDKVARDSDAFTKETAREARTKIRNALACKKHEPFRQAIEMTTPEMASTLRTRIERLDGLGVAVNQDLRRIIDKLFPNLQVDSVQRVKLWEDPNVIYVTAAGMVKKEQQLYELVNVKMKENARAIGAAIEHGDLSENSEYKFALEERDLLQARMRQMQQQLAKAHVFRPDQVQTSEVSIGTTVSLKSAEDGSAVSLSILGPWEADLDRGIYNYAAPLCQSLLGHKTGETVVLQLDARETSYAIESITLADFE